MMRFLCAFVQLLEPNHAKLPSNLFKQKSTTSSCVMDSFSNPGNYESTLIVLGQARLMLRGLSGRIQGVETWATNDLGFSLRYLAPRCVRLIQGSVTVRYCLSNMLLKLSSSGSLPPGCMSHSNSFLGQYYARVLSGTPPCILKSFLFSLSCSYCSRVLSSRGCMFTSSLTSTRRSGLYGAIQQDRFVFCQASRPQSPSSDY